MNKSEIFKNKKSRKILLVGGSGFIGKILAEKLLSGKSEITVLSKKVKDPIPGISYLRGDVRNKLLVEKSVKDMDLIIDLAALRPIESLIKPLEDLDITCRGALNILESCRKFNRNCTVVFFGSSLEYGAINKFPVSELNNLFLPGSFYGVHKLAVSHYSRIYHKMYGIKSIFLRFSNIYGPEKKYSGKMSVVNLFIISALKNRNIYIYGNGKQVRDFLYIEDALNALWKAISSPRAYGRVFNIGTGKPENLINLAKKVIKIVGKGKIKKIRWPEGYLYATNDYYADFSKAGKLLNWKPEYSLEEGIKLTVKKILEK